MEIKIQKYIKENETGISGAVKRAMADMKDGDTLLLGGETLHFYQEGTTQKYYCVSNNDKGEKQIVFPLIEKNNITIDGEGAELIFHGEILPFVIDGSSNITIKNLNIDYASPMYIQAQIVKVQEEYLELQFDEKEFRYRERDGEIWLYNDEDGWEKKFAPCLVTEMDGQTNAPDADIEFYIAETERKQDHGFMDSIFKHIQCENLGNGKLAVHGKIGKKHHAGNYWVATFDNNRYNPGIFAAHSQNVCLENMNLYHTLSMGIICQFCENVSLDRVSAKPREGSGRLLSVCADSTHFVNCRGKITIKDCLFTNMLDDAVNVHGIYHKLLHMEGNRLTGGVGHFQQEGIFGYQPGDQICLVNAETGKKEAFYTVKEMGVLDDANFWLEVKEPLQATSEEYVIENVSASPEIEISGCECGNNRPRGFLLSSPKKTVVENCIFYNMYAGIFIEAGVAGWYESGCVTDVTIRNNLFKNSAYVSGPAIQIVPVFGKEDLQHLHSGIVIEKNVFVQAEKRILCAHAVDGLVFRKNQFVCDSSLLHHEPIGEDGVELLHCEDVVYEPVQDMS